MQIEICNAKVFTLNLYEHIAIYRLLSKTFFFFFHSRSYRNSMFRCRPTESIKTSKSFILSLFHSNKWVRLRRNCTLRLYLCHLTTSRRNLYTNRQFQSEFSVLFLLNSLPYSLYIFVVFHSYRLPTYFLLPTHLIDFQWRIENST